MEMQCPPVPGLTRDLVNQAALPLIVLPGRGPGSGPGRGVPS